jgi:hypothetical protein
MSVKSEFATAGESPFISPILQKERKKREENYKHASIREHDMPQSENRHIEI